MFPKQTNKTFTLSCFSIVTVPKLKFFDIRNDRQTTIIDMYVCMDLTDIEEMFYSLNFYQLENYNQ